MKILGVLIIVLIAFSAKSQTLKKKDLKGDYTFSKVLPARTIGTSDTSEISIPSVTFSKEEMKLAGFGKAKRAFKFSSINQSKVGWEKGEWKIQNDTIFIEFRGKEEAYQFENQALKAIEAPHGYIKKD